MRFPGVGLSGKPARFLIANPEVNRWTQHFASGLPATGRMPVVAVVVDLKRLGEQLAERAGRLVQR